MEDGYVRTATPIVEAFCRVPLTSREARVIRVIERMTYGWQKAEDWIAASVISDMTGMSPGKCSETLNALIRKKVVSRAGGGQSPIRINKNVEEWDFSTQKARVTPKRETAPTWGIPPQDGVTKRPQDGETPKDRKDTNPLTSFGGDSSEPETTAADPAPEKTSAKPKPKVQSYPAEFEALWAEYPKRGGSNPKRSAFNAWQARRREGDSLETMLAGVQRYATHCRAKGNEHTEFVMQAQRFLGTNREFENEWQAPAAPPRADGRLGMAQPKPQGTYQTNDDDLPDWAKGFA
ncbi:replication protein [Salinicola halophilus]|uniref:replication protein n=1 Tax=Salinicola halophilus TaxID=184065 RepID=UPI0013A60ABE|nr:replication protein [Salinicola halophilus]